MTQEEKQALLGSLFQGANMAGAQIIALNEGEVYYQKYASGAAATTRTENEIRNALDRLMSLRDDKGDFIMREQQQWYAIYRVLSTYCGFPKSAAEFEKTMVNLGASQLRIPCKYESFRKIALHQLPQNVALWKQYQHTADQYSQKQVAVAVGLMEILELDGQ